MPSAPLLRLGTAEDIPAMYALDLLCFDAPFRFDLASMQHFVTERGAIVLIAEVSGTLAAFVILSVNRRSAYITTLDTHPDHRRQGLARALVLEAERRASAARASQVHLHVFTANEAAIRFYESLGYERLGRAEDFYAPTLDAFLYAKPL